MGFVGVSSQTRRVPAKSSGVRRSSSVKSTK